MSRGYMYVASCKKEYYDAAKISAESLLEFYPDAQITLVTHAEWVEPTDIELFSTIITEDVPTDNRAKLWALSRTPYDVTMYIDADTYIQSEDIEHVFDFIGDNDIIFTRNRPYNSKITKLNDTEEMIYHCGIFVYRKNDTMKYLTDDWYKQYLIQATPEYDASPYPEAVKPWDTFTMWWLLNKTANKYAVKVGEFPAPDARWNFCLGQKPEELDGQEIVITHYSIFQR